MPPAHNDDITQVRPRPAVAESLPEYRSWLVARGHAVVSAGNYVIHVGTSAADLGAIRALARATEHLCVDNERIGFITVLSNSAETRMSKELRAEIDAMVARFSARYGAAAIVMSAQGFAATAARSLVTSVNLSTQATHPNRVFAELDSALPWLREKFPVGNPDSNALRIIVSRTLNDVAAAGLSPPNAAASPKAPSPARAQRG